MKKFALISTTVVLSIALVASESPAQRRGGAGGGGAARPTPNRSPSMSRPAARPTAPSRPATKPSLPSRPSAGQKPATRPSLPAAGQKPATRPSLPTAGQKPATRPSPPAVGQKPATRPGSPAAGTRPAIDRDKIQNSIGAGKRPAMPDWFKPGTKPPSAAQLPARPGAGKPPGAGLPGKPGSGGGPVATLPIADGKPGRPPGAGVPPGTRPPVGTRPPIAGKPGRPPGVRPPGSRPPGLVPPPGRPQRPWYPSHPHYQSSDRWWKWATATAVTDWVVHRWAKPVYYRYGTGGNVYYDNNVVYVNGQQYGSPDQYYTEVSGIAAAVPETTEEQANADDWMPLGVFALTAEGVNATSMYLQLAIRKDGMIAGTFYNESTSVSHPVEGMVDEKTQRAVWKAADGTNPDLVMETGLYNLSEDQANVLVHFGPEKTQEVLLVRLEESEAPQTQE